MKVRGCVLHGCVVLLLLVVAVPAVAQWLPEEPVSIAGGHVVFGAEASFTFGPEDPGFFNYTDYQFSALRNARLGVSAEVRANDYLQVLGELRLDHGRVLEAYGLYARVRPWPARRFDIQAGRVPTTFGLMSRASYGNQNILIGQPLAYQYLMSIRPDAVPATNDDLLRMRGRGWESAFPVGNPTPAPGVPLVNTSRWDTGLQVHGIVRSVEWTGAITAGSLSDPRTLRDNNPGRQFAGRVVGRPTPGLAIGLSASRGAWLNETLDAAVAGAETSGSARQIAFGGDAEYSAGPLLVRGEAIRSAWTMPAIATLHLDEPLIGTSLLVEARYKVAPGLYMAVRGDRLDYSRISGQRGWDTWEARVWRIETGAGYSVTRNIQLKGAWQHNDRDGGRVRRDSLLAGQVLYWF
jgi:hypothetical protein